MQHLRSFNSLWIVAFAILLGCHENAARVSPSPDVPLAPVEQEPVPEKKSEPLKLSDLNENLGASCFDDRECNLYLRCLDRACDRPPAMTGIKRHDTPTAIFVVGTEEKARFQLELAVRPHEQTRGLMFRREMKDDWGMLFVYPDDEILSFWMKNTYIPLDMVFIDGGGTVVGVVTAEPLTLNPRSVGKPSRYVLELNAGTAKRLGIEAGVVMRLENIDSELAP